LYALWRQHPTLVQTLEDEYRRQPLTERELIFGQRPGTPEEANKELPEKDATPETSQKTSTPRVHRFILAERIQRLALDFQDALVATGKRKARYRRAHLFSADI
jgi:hypothetical protein